MDETTRILVAVYDTQVVQARHFDNLRSTVSGTVVAISAALVTHKRGAFAHEKEVRIVRFFSEDFKNFELKDVGVDPSLEPGLKVKWKLEDAVSRIVVSPYCPEWYFDTVKDMVAKFTPSLSDRVRWSALRVDPIF